MKVLLCGVALVLNCLALATEQPPPQFHVESQTRNPLLANADNSNVISSKGYTPYIEKDENMLRMPIIKHINEHRSKKKSKKNPKRTIQKIIKKNGLKSKIRKMYFKVTDKPKASTGNDNYEMYEQSWNSIRTTTQASLKRKPKKWTNKIPRYRMPFQGMQGKKERRHKRKTDFVIRFTDQLQRRETNTNPKILPKEYKTKRTKREVSREIYILKDFDDIQYQPSVMEYDFGNSRVNRP